MRGVALGLLTVYQATISPDKSFLFRGRLGGRICSHVPHCSEYARECFQKYHFFTALHYTMERVSSCVPRYETQYDPSSYRVVFFSSAPIWVPFMQEIAKDPRFDLVWVVTMPDAPVGRWMKLQENIMKQEAKKLIESWELRTDAPVLKASKVVLLHGKDATPEDKRYPWFIDEMKKKNISILAPSLPKKNDPVLEERLAEIDTLCIDEHTLVIGHSRGWVALLRWIETRKKAVWKIVLVATNDSVSNEDKHWFFSHSDYAYDEIKKNCSDITVLHSLDDTTVPFAHWEKIAAWLWAKTWFPKWLGHFWKNLGWRFEELLPFVFVNNIHTPRSLRLDSKKYASDAHTFKQRASDVQPDLFVVIAYGHIMQQRVLDLPRFWSINVHGSLLPEYRGASPLQSIFLDGKEKTGLTIMHMDAWVDTWDMIDTLETPVPLSRTVRDLIEWIKDKWPLFLTETLRNRGKWTLPRKQQNNELASWCRKFEKEDWLIDPLTDNMLEVRQKRQAFALWPKLYFFWWEKRISIDSIVLKHGVSRDDLWGRLITKSENSYLLHSAVWDIRLVPEGKKWVRWDEFVNGYGKL